MAYVYYSYYQSLYGENSIPEADFKRLSWDASRKLDIATTGADNFPKLRQAFPTDEYAAEAVKHCACALVNTMYQLLQAEAAATAAQGYTQREDGSLQGKVVTSVSAGNESISYSAKGSEQKTLMSVALADADVREKMYQDTIREYLSGIADANGVNLLFMGEYPRHKLNSF